MDPRPHGRDEVRQAIITAAKRRFATQGPSASTREIAADADVNLGLLHRHFGSKESLIRAVFADASAQGYARTADVSSVAQALDRILTDDTTYGRVLAGMPVVRPARWPCWSAAEGLVADLPAPP